MKYEYSVWVPPSIIEFEKSINNLAKEGWRIIHIDLFNGHIFIYHLEREVEL
jgi:hypothetical protein